MAQNLPSWLDKGFLATLLQGGENKEPKITVENFSAVLAVAAGNNYTSEIFRVQVTYKAEGSQEQSTSLIIKAPLAQFQNMSEIGLSELFDKEPKVYHELLPKLKEKIKQEFGPTTYYCPQKNVLALQDMKEAGYDMCDKFKQLDYAHCEIVFKTMAKFHATSVATHHENPEEIEKLGAEPIFSEGNPMFQMMKPLIDYAMKVVLDTIRQTKDSEPVVQFFLSKKDNFFESLIEICKPKKTGLNVLNHGDLWINNMLFQHDDSGKVLDVKFIDFQAVRYMTPAVDLHYFTWTSADENVRENKLIELYDVYLQTLNDALEQLGCKERYTMEELWQDYKSSINFAISVLFQTFPLMMVEPQDALDMSEFDMKDFLNAQGPDPRMLEIYNGKQFKAKIPNIAKQLYKLASSL